jgi:two-component system KDP operon response regulator KdpE
MDPRPTILVVEDEPEIRRFLRSSLEAEGYRVAESATARRGVVDAGTHKPDVVIVDLGLPDFDGVEVVRQIRRWSTLPILILSARTQERAKIDAFEAGADDYVTSPSASANCWRGSRLRCGTRPARRPVAPSCASTVPSSIWSDARRRGTRRLCTSRPSSSGCLPRWPGISAWW